MPRKTTPVANVPVDLAAAATTSLAELGIRAGGKAFKVPCAYHSCERVFLPDGIGAWIHSSCPIGTKFFGPWTQANKAGDPKADAILAKAKEIATLAEAQPAKAS